MTGQGGWPLNVFLTPDAGAVLRRHLLPARAAPRHAVAGGRCCSPSREGWRERRAEIVADAGAAVAAARRRRAGCDRRPTRSAPRCSSDASAALRGELRQRAGRLGPRGRGPKFPAASVIEFLLARGEPAMALQTLRAMASGGIYDQVGGGFARYSVDAHLDGPALREDALRQRAAGARVPARLARQRRPGPAAHLRGDPRLGAARDARRRTAGSSARSTPTPRARRAASTSGRRAELISALGADADAALAWLGATDAGQLPDGRPGANVLESRGPEPEPEVRERIRARLLDVRERRVRPATRRQAADVLERADDQRAGRRRRRRWSAPTTSTPRATPRGVLLEVQRDADGRLLRTSRGGRRQAARLPRGPRVPARGAAHPLRGDVRGALVRRRARDRRRAARALRRRRARRLLLHGRRRTRR